MKVPSAAASGAAYAADGTRIASFAQEQLFRTLRPVRPDLIRNVWLTSAHGLHG